MPPLSAVNKADMNGLEAVLALAKDAVDLSPAGRDEKVDRTDFNIGRFK